MLRAGQSDGLSRFRAGCVAQVAGRTWSKIRSGWRGVRDSPLYTGRPHPFFAKPTTPVAKPSAPVAS